MMEVCELFLLDDIANYIYNFLEYEDLKKLLKIKSLRNFRCLLGYLIVSVDKLNNNDVVRYGNFIKKIRSVSLDLPLIKYFSNITELEIHNFNIYVFNKHNFTTLKKITIDNIESGTQTIVNYPRKVKSLTINNFMPNTIIFPEELDSLEITIFDQKNIPTLPPTKYLTINNRCDNEERNIIDTIFLDYNIKIEEIILSGFGKTVLNDIGISCPNLKKLITDGLVDMLELPDNLEVICCFSNGESFFPKSIKYIRVHYLRNGQIEFDNFENLEHLEYLEMKGGIFKKPFKLPPNLKFFHLIFFDTTKKYSIWDISENEKLETITICGFDGLLVIPDKFILNKLQNINGYTIKNNDYIFMTKYLAFHKFELITITTSFGDFGYKKMQPDDILRFGLKYGHTRICRILIDTFFRGKIGMDSLPDLELTSILIDLTLSNHIKLLKLLVKKYGVDINITNKFTGDSLLHGACLGINHNIIKFLVANKIKNIKNNLGKYPVDYILNIDNPNLLSTKNKILSYLKKKHYWI